MRNRGIFFKTFVYLMGLMILLISVIHLTLYFSYNDIYKKNKEVQINKHIEIIKEKSDCSDLHRIDEFLENYAKNNNINIALKYDKNINYYQGNSFFVKYFFENNSDYKLGNVKNIDVMKVKTFNIKILNFNNSKIQIVENIQALKESREIALNALPFSILISFVFSLIFSYVYSRKITEPIKEISIIVNKMSKLEKNLHIKIKNDDEIGKLGNNINYLYDELLKLIQEYKNKNQYILDIEKERLNLFRSNSHELKTPLAKLSILIESMKYNIGKYKDRDKYLDESLIIINDLSRMISEILDKTKIDTLEIDSNDVIDIREVLVKVINEYEILAKYKGIKINKDVKNDFKLNISRENLEKVISNILSNAVKHGNENGQIRIIIDSEKFSVFNESEKINKNILEKIWKGEYTLDRSNIMNSGMGLFIVKNILEKYNIKYTFLELENGYEFSIYKI